MNNRLLAVVALASAVLLSACAKTSDCKGDASVCDGACVRLESDNQNCGACGAACAAGKVCSQGACEVTCAAGLVECAGSCVDPRTDRAFCGARGNCTGLDAGASCAAGELCSAGSCALSCQGGLVDCAGKCVDPLSDRAFCGASGSCTGSGSGVSCSEGEVCSGGVCGLSCQAGLVDCGGKCVDPLTDRASCGASGSCTGAETGATCDGGKVCSNGACALTCQAGLVNCGGKCVDPLIDRAFCGASGSCLGPEAGTSCAAGEVCSGGTCALTCQAGLVDCGGKCVDPLTERAFCGASGSCTGNEAGEVCAAGTVCDGGTCALSCQDGLVNCGGRCVDPQVDRAFCGASGTCTGAAAGATCTSGNVCDGGTCVLSCQGGLVNCGGTCVDPMTDRAHCGAAGSCSGVAAGAACATGEVCSAGACAVSCQAGMVNCGGTCTDPVTSRTHCGATGTCTGTQGGAACAGGQVCRAGSCVTVCGAGQILCNSGCIDPNTSTAFCGASGDCTGALAGVACRANAYCSHGTCPCSVGLVDCNGTCTSGCPATTTCATGQTSGCSANVPLTPAAMAPLGNCGNGSYYNQCSGAYALTWTDTIGLAPIGIEVRFTQSVSCANTPTVETVNFNGATFGTFTEQANQCTCTPSGFPETTLSSADGAVLAGFVPGGSNSFRFTPVSNCEGLRTDAEGYIARVILTY